MPFKNKEKFFEKVMLQLSGEIVVFDLNRRYVFVNASAFSDPEIRKKIIGMNDFEYCAYRGKDISIAEDRKKIFDEIEKTRKEVEWEEKFVDATGNERYFVRRCSPIIDDGGSLSGFVGYGIEITERIKLEKSNLLQQQFLQKILDASPQMIFVKDAKGKFLMANNAMADSLGVPKDQIIGHYNDSINVNEEELKQYAYNDNLVIETNQTVRIEEKFTKTDGTVLIYDTVKSPILEPDGTVNVLGISTDITELKRAEEKIRLNEQHLIDAQRMALSGSWEFDVETGLTTWSPGMYSIFERDMSDGVLSNEERRRFISDNDQQAINEKVALLYTGTEKIEFESALNLPTGKKMVRTVAKAEKDSNGKVFRLLGTVIDITLQKETENLLQD